MGKSVVMAFPISLLSMAYTRKAAGSLRPMLSKVYLCHIGLRFLYNTPDDDTFDEEITDFYGLTPEESEEVICESVYFSPDNMIEYCRDSYNRQSKKGTQPYTSITVNVFKDFWDNDHRKTDFEKASLIAYMALKSILGNKIAGYVKWELLLSRMAGNTRIVAVDEMPKEIQRYNSRKLKDKLRKSLIEKWKVQYYFKGRNPWYSLKRKPFLLKDWVENRGTPK